MLIVFDEIKYLIVGWNTYLAQEEISLALSKWPQNAPSLFFFLHTTELWLLPASAKQWE